MLFAPVAREDVRRELDEDVPRGLDRLEARRRELRATLDAGDAASAPRPRRDRVRGAGAVAFVRAYDSSFASR